jgi:hypothetical protein
MFSLLTQAGEHCTSLSAISYFLARNNNLEHATLDLLESWIRYLSLALFLVGIFVISLEVSHSLYLFILL